METDMQYCQLGTSGLEISVIGLGGTNFGTRADDALAATIIDSAIDRGINLIDTANIYSAGKSEEAIGKALVGKRDQVVLTSKFGQRTGDAPMMSGGSRRHIMTAVEDSLRRLQTDHLDLYQMHIPDPLVPIEETLRALDDLVRQGKVRYIGSSCFEAWQVAEAELVARSLGTERFVSTQCHYSLLTRDVEHHLLPVCDRYGIGVLPFFSLESGLLTGKYRAGAEIPADARAAKFPQFFFGDMSDESFAKIEALYEFATERDHTLTELALAAILPRPGVSSIVVGAMSPEQLDGSLAAAGWKLTAEELAEIDELAPSPVPKWLRFLTETATPVGRT
ncbi:MAG: aldo/keto reductase [Acidimicrobiales bacterium]|nr:aldo/keto reductase [Acidimicrobiales bacterium]